MLGVQQNAQEAKILALLGIVGHGWRQQKARLCVMAVISRNKKAKGELSWGRVCVLHGVARKGTTDKKNLKGAGMRRC